ncbi:MAG: acyl-CoA carboxylase subunit beta, partial [Bacteroidia bacterium]|nr:acyl-CoA carboxylase subunit beta [Bacteroidia bacterium]
MKAKELEFNKNEDFNKMQLSHYRKLALKIELGGGEKSANKQHAKGKLLARERIDYLKDQDADFLEIGKFAG